MTLNAVVFPIRLRVACIAWLSILCIPVAASQTAEPADSIEFSKNVDLHEVTVSAPLENRPTRVGTDGKISVDAISSGERMRVFGEADAIRVLKTMPGVSAGSDYASGVSIEGGEFSHTFYGIGGAPVFFPYHFGGIFSVFNTEHFPVLSMEKSIHTPDMPGFIGGRIDFAQREALTRRPGGVINLGLTAAGASVATPAGTSADITASVRTSYINLLYGKLLRDNTTDINYGFTDFNLSVRLRPGGNDRLNLNFFLNRDYLSTSDSRYALGTRFGWHNILGVCEWDHTKGRFEWHQSLYCSTFGSDFNMSMTNILAGVTSSITQIGMRGHGAYDLTGSGCAQLLFGCEGMFTGTHPQNISVSGFGDTSFSSGNRYSSVEGRAYVACSLRLSPSLSLTAGGRLTTYSSHGYKPIFFDPTATLTWRSRAGTFNLHAANYTQTLHQVGFSDIGLAYNFWLAADRTLKAQRSNTLSASWLIRPDGGNYELSADIYYKRLRGASEYEDMLISMLDPGYDYLAHILTGKGRNYGGGVMLSRVYGQLTGSASLSYGRAQRYFPTVSSHWLTAAVEQRFGCTLQLHYRVSHPFSVDASWTYTTGRPITPVESLYLIGENVVSVYGERNSRTLPAYHRLDLSASWHFRIKSLPGIGNTLILSIINAYGHRNVSMMTYGYDASDKRFTRHYTSSLYRFLPSVAYVIRF